MTKLNGWRMGEAAFVLCAVWTIASQAQTTTVLAFQGPNGADPAFTTPVQGQDGKLYGTTLEGGRHNAGVIFSTTADGMQKVLGFCQPTGCFTGVAPEAGLILGSDGTFYGTTTACTKGTCGGTIFSVTPGGKIDLLHSLNGADGSLPYGPLVEGTDGNLYGTTSDNTYGTVFKISKTGRFNVLHTFTGSNGEGAIPRGTLVEGSNGDFYGTTLGGGSYQDECSPGCGTIFKVSASGNFATIYEFATTQSSQGYNPSAGLVLGLDGNFYGTTLYSLDGEGTVFKITPAGVLTTLYNFADPSSGTQPSSQLVLGSDGNFYGTTFGGGAHNSGTIFMITPNGTVTTLSGFAFPTASAPFGGLLQATTGVFYGSTTEGGDLGCGNGVDGCGTLYSLDTGLGPFVAFVQAAGKVGQTAQILGQGFTGTTSVTLSGVPATFTVVSDTFMKATIPSGATTGYVTVTTPGRVLTSNVPFHVIP